MAEDELDVLLDRYFDGELPDEEEAGLWNRIRREQSVADRFVERSELESALVERYREHAIAPPTLPLPKPRPPAERRWAAGPLTIAAAVLLAAGAFIIFLTARSGSDSLETAEPVADDPPVLERVEGDVFIVGASGSARAGKGSTFFSGNALDVRDPYGRVVLAYADGTRVTANAGTLLRRPDRDRRRGKRLVVSRGTLSAEVERQDALHPMRIITPHGEAVVLGTSFWIRVGRATQVTVNGGRVRLSRPDGDAVDIRGGHAAVVTTDSLRLRELAGDEVLLRAGEARIVGADWSLVEDDTSSLGAALEVPDLSRPQEWIPEIPRISASWAEFTFHAEAGREYHLWMRGHCLNGDHQSDWIVAELTGGAFTGRPNGHQGRVGEPRLHYMNGYFLKKGYHWAGGDIEKRPNEDYTKILGIVRFERTGPQTLRLHAKEGPMRVDAVWLSSRQTTLPAPDASPDDMIK